MQSFPAIVETALTSCVALVNRKESRAHRGRKRLTHRARYGSVAVGGVSCSDFACGSSIADAHSHSMMATDFSETIYQNDRRSFS